MFNLHYKYSTITQNVNPKYSKNLHYFNMFVVLYFKGEKYDYNKSQTSIHVVVLYKKTYTSSGCNKDNQCCYLKLKNFG